MDLKKITHFVVLAKTLNFHKAADQLNISQPPLSLSIQKLEQELNVPLFIRTTRGVSLTPEGQRLLPEAIKLLNHAEQFKHMANDLHDGMVGSLHLGFVGSVARSILPTIISSFKQNFPKIELNFHEDTSSHILNAVTTNKLDVGIVRSPILDHVDIEFLQLEKDHFLLAIPYGHDLEKKTKIQLKDLQNYAFILHSPDEAKGLHHAMMNAFQEAGFIPKISQVATQTQTVMALVEAQFGLALVPAMSSIKPSANIVFKKMEDESKISRIGFAMIYLKNSQNLMLKRFIESINLK